MLRRLDLVHWGAVGLGTALALVACGDDGGGEVATTGEVSTGAAETTEGGSTTTGTTTTGMTSSGGGSTGQNTSEAESSTGATGSSTTTGVDPLCGNGEIDSDEECDDGNTVIGDGCNADCRNGGELVWDERLDAGSAEDELHAIAVDASGNLYIGGHHRGAAGGVKWVSKRDPEGSEIWTWEQDEAGEDQVFDLALAETGEVYLAGRGEAGGVGGKAWVGKLDAEGSLLWSQATAGEPGLAATAYAIAVRPDGGVLAAGTLTPVGETDLDLWLQFFGEDGAPGAARLIDPYNSNDLAFAVAIHEDGDVLVAGTSSPVGVTVRRLRSDLSDRWHRDFGSSALYGAAFDADGNAFVAGRDLGGATSRGFVRKYSETGELAWERFDEGPLAALYTRLTVDALGNVIVAGAEIPVTEPHPLVVKYDPDGQIVWRRVYDEHDGVAWDVAANDLGVGVAGLIVEATETDFWFAKYTP